MREVAAALSGISISIKNNLEAQYLIFPLGMGLTKAYAYLAAVKDHKRVIPFRRFAGGVGRASQAKEFKATQGA
jgi:large subunit ribosomal protein L17e